MEHKGGARYGTCPLGRPAGPESIRHASGTHPRFRGANMAKAQATRTRLEAGPAGSRLLLENLDDSALVAAFLAGEKRAFTVLVERYNGRLVNFVYRTTGDR